jgi:hypothetical protein
MCSLKRLADHIIVTGDSKGFLAFYTLEEVDGSPQRRLLPGLKYPAGIYHSCYPSFRATAAHPDLMPGCVPSLESQAMVIEVLPDAFPLFFTSIFPGNSYSRARTKTGRIIRTLGFLLRSHLGLQ